jgi:hypothetical protein
VENLLGFMTHIRAQFLCVVPVLDKIVAKRISVVAGDHQGRFTGHVLQTIPCGVCDSDVGSGCVDVWFVDVRNPGNTTRVRFIEGIRSMNIIDVLDTFVMALNAFMIYTGGPVTSSIETPGGAVARYRWCVDSAAVGMAVCRHIIVAAGAPLFLFCYEDAFVANHAIPVVRGAHRAMCVIIYTVIVPTRAVAVVAISFANHSGEISILPFYVTVPTI